MEERSGRVTAWTEESEGGRIVSFEMEDTTASERDVFHVPQEIADEVRRVLQMVQATGAPVVVSYSIEEGGLRILHDVKPEA
jgi:hypothetical protein